MTLLVNNKIGKDREGRGCDLIYGNVAEFV
jgi:hypothetical protein